MSAIRKPCASCPWRVDQHAGTIPNFSLELAERLEATCAPGQELGAPMFACHQSRPGEEIVCAGWLARYGRESVGVRLNVALGHMSAEALDPGVDWPDLHETFEEVITKLRADCAPLSPDRKEQE